MALSFSPYPLLERRVFLSPSLFPTPRQLHIQKPNTALVDMQPDCSTLSLLFSPQGLHQRNGILTEHPRGWITLHLCCQPRCICRQLLDLRHLRVLSFSESNHHGGTKFQPTDCGVGRRGNDGLNDLNSVVIHIAI